MRLQENQVFANRYLLQRRIGVGGFSEVWKAADRYIPGVIVALKVYATERGLDKESIELFSGEYMLTKSLKNAHLVEVIYYDIFEESPYLVMPFYTNGSLAQVLNTNGPLPEAEVAKLMFEITDALSYLHNQDPPVLHRDIKPDNLLIADDKSYLLSDFGISRRVRHTIAKNTGKASQDSMSIAYSAPERFSRNPQTTPASDIFSFGVMLYQVCAGQLPWDENGGVALLRGAQIPDIPPIYSRKLNQIICQCMDIDPLLRPTASQLKEWAKGFLTENYWKVGINPPQKAGKKKYLVPALIVSAFLLCALLLFAYNKRQKSEIVGNSNTREQPADTTQNDNTNDANAALPDSTKVNDTEKPPMAENTDNDTPTGGLTGTASKQATGSAKDQSVEEPKAEKPRESSTDEEAADTDKAKKREEELRRRQKERDELRKKIEKELEEEKEKGVLNTP